MNRIFLLAVLLVATLSFQIQTESPNPQPTLESIPWPFTTCGDADWTI